MTPGPAPSGKITTADEMKLAAMAIAQKWVQRTNADIAHGIFREISELEVGVTRSPRMTDAPSETRMYQGSPVPSGKPHVYWDDTEGCYVVPDGACPYPIGNDDGTVEMCMANGNCGCDARLKQTPESPND